MIKAGKKLLRTAILIMLIGSTMTTAAWSDGNTVLEMRGPHIEHSSVVISGDTELMSVAANESWPGNGTEGNPFIVSGLDINGTGSIHGIHVRDTSLYLDIVDNVIEEARHGNGIFIENSENIRVIDNRIKDSGNSSNILLDGCNDTLIRGNHLEGNLSQDSIRVMDSIRVRIEGNELLWSQEHGISSYDCMMLEIIDNRISNAKGSGIQSLIGRHNLIQGNRIENCQEFGIDDSSNYLTVYDNRLHGNGITVSDLDRLTLSDNNTIDGDPIRFYNGVDLNGIEIPHNTSQFILNEVTGFHLSGMEYESPYQFLIAHDSSDISIEGCRIDGARYGFNLIYCDDVSITDSTLSNISSWGIRSYHGRGYDIVNNSFEYISWMNTMYYTMDITYHDNEFRINNRSMEIVNTDDLDFTNNTLTGMDEGGIGLELSSVFKANVSSNSFQGFDDAGIFGSNTNRCLFSENRISNKENGNKGVGINLIHPDRSEIAGNHIHNCMNGLKLEYDSYGCTVSGNLIEDNPGDGIRITNGDDYIVRENLLFNNGGFGVNITGSDGCKVFNNTFIDNNGASESYSTSHIQAYSSGTVDWDFEMRGNYWSDWTGPDSDSNGIVDDPYLIFGSTVFDDFPLVEPSFIYLSEPIDFNVTSTPDRVEIQWDRPDFDLDGSLSGYILTRTGGSGPDLHIVFGPTVLNYTDTETEDGVEYGYSLKAVNRYGPGRSTDTMEAMSDSIPPSVSILYPVNGSFIAEKNLTVTWTSSDNVGIQSTWISVDGAEWTSADSDNSHSLSNLTEGEHNITVRVHDSIGNLQLATVDFTVDLTSPVLEIISPINGTVTNESSVMISWESDDNLSGIGSHSIRLDDGEWTDLGMNKSFNISLPTEGWHTIDARAFDIAGNMIGSSVSVMLDVTKPDLFFTFPADGYNTTDTSFEVRWTAYDPGSGISGFTISIDEGAPMDLSPSVSMFTLTSLTTGSHRIHLESTDNAGNRVNITLDFEIIPKDTEPTEVVIRGMVLDEKGDPVHKAMVTADTGVYTYTDSTGVFALVVTRGQRILTITRKDLISRDIQVDASGTEQINLTDTILSPMEDEDDNDEGERIWERSFCQICCLLMIIIPLFLMLLGLLRRARRKKKERKGKAMRIREKKNIITVNKTEKEE